ncbi:DUF2304 family protein [Methanobrevibacter sp. OttesenSCG-928-K11]|nr:DUF2304 family protein [Methanobrevibacter sp. OttesenSCG-928-K11]MDL2270765.1 DUF2304 family protein [Methanobrevibacter sp. OttesenSCG-928-I08]
MIPLYPIFFILIAVIAIVFLYFKFRENRISLSSFIVWIILWIFIVIFAIDPDASGVFAAIFGITRGLDFIIIIAIIGLLYLSLKLFLRIENLQQDINKLVRELAIKNEIDLEKDKKD